jgi:hypothetical protein
MTNFRDSPFRFGISFSGVGGPANAPPNIAFSLSLMSWGDLFMPHDPLDKPFTLPPEITQGLGEIVIAWARVEALLAEFLSFLLEADPGSMYVLNQDISSSTQLKWIRTLAGMRFADENTVSNLAILFDRIDSVRGERNTYVHGVWGTSTEPSAATVQTVKLDRAELVRTELVTGPDLSDVFNEIKAVSAELHMVGKKLGFIRTK